MANYDGKIITIERFILDHQPDDADGDFTGLMYDIALAAKIISQKINRAGLEDILGRASSTNVHGEDQQKMDVFADDLIFRLCDHTGRLCAMASEEQDEFIPIPDEYAKGEYVLVYDPLDGSSNIDVNVSVGMVFAIFRTVDYEKRGRLEDCLQPGKDIVASGYVLFGSSTMLVYSWGDGVHGFTLDPDLGEFLLSHERMRFPDKPAYYSFNGAYQHEWEQSMRDYVEWLHSDQSPALSGRYIGSFIADFHRNLLKGGIYLYPGEISRPDGKLRLLYEAGPLAYLAENAGGYASNGYQSILDLVPTSLHECTPVIVGNRNLVEMAEKFIQGK